MRTASFNLVRTTTEKEKDPFNAYEFMMACVRLGLTRDRHNIEKLQREYPPQAMSASAEPMIKDKAVANILIPRVLTDLLIEFNNRLVAEEFTLPARPIETPPNYWAQPQELNPTERIRWAQQFITALATHPQAAKIVKDAREARIRSGKWKLDEAIETLAPSLHAKVAALAAAEKGL